MSYKSQIRDYAISVNQSLSTYISVHDFIHKESATFKSTLKNLFGKGVSNSELLGLAEKLKPIWVELFEEFDSFKSNSYSNLSNDEKFYFDLLYCYVVALDKTTKCLIDRESLLNERSKTPFNRSSNWASYQEKVKAYEISIENYKTIGRKLNNYKHLIFS